MFDRTRPADGSEACEGDDPRHEDHGEQEAEGEGRCRAHRWEASQRARTTRGARPGRTTVTGRAVRGT